MTEEQKMEVAINFRIDDIIHSALNETGEHWPNNKVLASMNRWQDSHNLQGRFIAIHSGDVAKIEHAHDTLLEMLTMFVGKEQALALPLLKGLRQVSSKYMEALKK